MNDDDGGSRDQTAHLLLHASTMRGHAPCQIFSAKARDVSGLRSFFDSYASLVGQIQKIDLRHSLHSLCGTCPWVRQAYRSDNYQLIDPSLRARTGRRETYC